MDPPLDWTWMTNKPWMEPLERVDPPGRRRRRLIKTQGPKLQSSPWITTANSHKPIPPNHPIHHTSTVALAAGMDHPPGGWVYFWSLSVDMPELSSFIPRSMMFCWPDMGDGPP